MDEDLDEPLSSDEETDLTAPIENSLAIFVEIRLLKEQPKEKLKVKFKKATRPTNLLTTKRGKDQQRTL